jgi:RNA polymerase primary sigma factor
MDNEGREYSAITRLIALGLQKSYLTLDDILAILPEDERDASQLEEVFSAMFRAGIHYMLESLDENGPLDDDDLVNIDVDDGVRLYLREVGRIPLLTQKEEVELAQRIERGRLASEELASGEFEPRRRQELGSLIETGWGAREHLVKANSRLVVSVAKKYSQRGVPFQDLIQEGNIGLMRAAKKFDYKRGFKFSTYATWWIRQAISRAISDQGRTIRVPVHVHELISKMFRTRHQIMQRLGREPTVEELAEVLDISPDRVEEVIQVARLPLSMEMPTNHEGDGVLGDFIEDEKAPTPEELATFNLLREHFEDVFKSLSPREVYVLKWRYGLLGGKTHTLAELGRKIGVSRERVRQIEWRALQRLRSPSIRRDLRAYLE